MVCKYPRRTWSILSGMIITGAARSVAVKLAYQSGLRAPLTITLLYLLGQSMSLVVYWMSSRTTTDYVAAPTTEGGMIELRPARRRAVENDVGPSGNPADPDERAGRIASSDVDDDCDDRATALFRSHGPTTAAVVSPLPPPSHSRPPTSSSDSVASGSSSSSYSAIAHYFYSSLHDYYHDGDEGNDMPNGSTHGLSDESEEWTRRKSRVVPHHMRPLIPAVLNLLNSGLRWASLLYVDASVAEMMISGLELSLGAVAARAFRCRRIAPSRWAGVAMVAIGVMIVERANRGRHRGTDDDDGEATDDRGDDAVRPHGGSASDATIGVVLIILQSTLSVLQDIGEEIFMQAADFPATKMLGMEGSYGFCVGLVAYATIGRSDLGRGIEDVDSTLSTVRDNANVRRWVVGLPFLFLVTGIFNIKATEATSAMTRNVWKNMRTVLVWVVSLGIFYLGRDSDYGEAWHTPESAYILFGFTVMTTGIVAYYWYKEQEQSNPVLDDGTESESASK